ncbi:MAG: glycine--tRNA ligase [Candidatus Pacearchaeota archaeon]|jgi:glycyl-tRNA synthetase
MAFIVKKKISGKDYYYLNENKREEGKVKTKTLAYLGKNKKVAQEKMKKVLTEIEREKEITIKNTFKNEIKDSEKSKEKNKNSISNIKPISIEELTMFCKRKGFVYPSSEIYGGLAGFWDFGPLGVELLNNIKKDWWNYFVSSRNDIVGVEASVISHPRVWVASGHVANFTDVFVKCKKCGKTNKIDESELEKVKCIFCNGDYENLGKFNLMFETKVGAYEPMNVYLRGETAQGMFINFKLVQQTSRMQLPFGIAQIGRCFRNEIAPRDFLFRSREFHIGEFEFFINPEEKKCSLLSDKQLKLKIKFLDSENQKNGNNILREITIEEMIKERRLEEWHAYWLAEQILWFNSIGLTEIKIREHTKEELSHYSSATFDIDYEYVFGSKEIAGNANRGQYDLTQHEKESKQSMEIFDEKYKNKIIPKVIEPTFGIERIFLGILTKAYFYDDKRQNIVLKLPAKLAPIKIAIFPLVRNNPEIMKLSNEIYEILRKDFNVEYDESGSIGRRYARNDEIGTPFCVTIDEESLKKKDVTIRDRDTTKQIRIKIKDLKNILKEFIDGKKEFNEI